MITFRQKEYTGLARKVSAKAQRSVLNGAQRFFESKAGEGYLRLVDSPVARVVKDSGKGVGAIGKTIKMAGQNPGKAVRRATAGTIIDPKMAAAEAGDLYLSIAYPVYNAIPLNLKMAAAAGGKHMPKMPMKVRRVGYNMMRNNGASAASRAGMNLEHNINRAVLDTNQLMGHLTGVA